MNCSFHELAQGNLQGFRTPCAEKNGGRVALSHQSPRCVNSAGLFPSTNGLPEVSGSKRTTERLCGDTALLEGLFPGWPPLIGRSFLTVGPKGNPGRAT